MKRKQPPSSDGPAAKYIEIVSPHKNPTDSTHVRQRRHGFDIVQVALDSSESDDCKSQDSDAECVTPSTTSPVTPGGIDVERVNLLHSCIHTYLLTAFFPSDVATDLFDDLINHADWKLREFKLFGKIIVEPRKTAFWSLPDGETINYRYSGRDHHGAPCPPKLRDAAKFIEARLKELNLISPNFEFNFILANLYRNGDDYIGWHSDEERCLTGPIASASLGQTRKFSFKWRAVPPRLLKKTDKQSLETHAKISKDYKVTFPVCHRDLLLMDSMSQVFYKHTVLKERAVGKPRINLTFRRIKVDE